MVLGKLFAIVMFPLSILIILAEIGLFELDIGINKVLLGSVLMIILQLITIIMLYINHKRPTLMNFATAIIFIGIALIATLNVFIQLFPSEVNIILGVMMFVEALYALH